MKHFERLALASLLLLLGAVSGTCRERPDSPAPGDGQEARKDDGTIVILPPEFGAVVLPQFSTETFRMIGSITLEAELLDGADKALFKPTLAQWRNGAWRNAKGEVVPRLMFPLKDLRFQNNRLAGRYKLKYQFALLKSRSVYAFEQVDYLPLSKGVNFWVQAALPVDLVSVDAGGLEWADSPEADGVRTAKTQIKRSLGGKLLQESFILSSREPQAALVADKTGAVTADITFDCVSKRKHAPLKWDGSGKDLRAQPYGLNVTLSQPACPK